MSGRFSGWQCIGCGRIDVPRPCVGVCQDQAAEFVRAADYDAAIAEAERLRRRSARLASLLRLLAGTAPREGEWEACYRGLQRRARAMLREKG